MPVRINRTQSDDDVEVAISLAILQGIWNDDPVAIEVDRWCRHEMQHGLPTRDSNEMILRQWRRVAGADLEWRAFLA